MKRGRPESSDPAETAVHGGFSRAQGIDAERERGLGRAAPAEAEAAR